LKSFREAVAEMKINVKVKPAARENGVVERNGELIVSTTTHAHGGKANEAVRHIVAGHFGVPPSRVSVVRGFTSRRKIIEVL